MSLAAVRLTSVCAGIAGIRRIDVSRGPEWRISIISVEAVVVRIVDRLGSVLKRRSDTFMGLIDVDDMLIDLADGLDGNEHFRLAHPEKSTRSDVKNTNLLFDEESIDLTDLPAGRVDHFSPTDILGTVTRRQMRVGHDLKLERFVLLTCPW
jgi:hypothetical protein